MGSCCQIGKDLQEKKQVLLYVLLINSIMFFAQFSAGIFGRSTALLADSLDMLGDALTYGLSLYAISRGGCWLARAALFKGMIISFFALFIISEAIYKIFLTTIEPSAMIMSIFSILGLIANGSCLLLLTRHRKKDINMESTWICARNDIIGNIAVLVTASLVMYFHSRWPDIIIGLALACVLLQSAFKIIRKAVQSIHQINKSHTF